MVYCIAILEGMRTRLGMRFYDTEAGTTFTASIQEIQARLSKNPDAIKNVRLKGNDFVGVGGALSRYSVVDFATGAITGTCAVVVIGRDEENSRYWVVSPYGFVALMSADEIIANSLTLANGKIVSRGNKRIVSALEGSFDVIDSSHVIAKPQGIPMSNPHGVANPQGTSVGEAKLSDNIINVSIPWREYNKISSISCFSEKYKICRLSGTEAGDSAAIVFIHPAAREFTLNKKLFDELGDTPVVILYALGTELRDITAYFTFKFPQLVPIESLSLRNTRSLRIVCSEPSIEYLCLNGLGVTEIDLEACNLSNLKGLNNCFAGCKNLRNVRARNLAEAKPKSMNFMFYDCGVKLTAHKRAGALALGFDLTWLNTSECDTMAFMFAHTSAENGVLDLRSFDTRKVTDMCCMFFGCDASSLLLDTFDTANVTNMLAMFRSCTKLTDLDVSSFYTENVTNMSSMFRDCRQLSRITGLEYFKTGSVKSMTGMFKGTLSLTVLDLSYFDTSSVESMAEMFSDAFAEEWGFLDLMNFNLSSLTCADDMFAGMHYVVHTARPKRVLSERPLRVYMTEDVYTKLSHMTRLPELAPSSTQKSRS